VVDVPAKLAAQVRLFDRHNRKTTRRALDCGRGGSHQQPACPEGRQRA
jgi:hypothetical protein